MTDVFELRHLATVPPALVPRLVHHALSVIALVERDHQEVLTGSLGEFPPGVGDEGGRERCDLGIGGAPEAPVTQEEDG